jgi:acyl-CoA dehydrogenase
MTRPMTAAMGLGLAKAALDFTRDELEKAGVSLEYGTGTANQSAAADRFMRLEGIYEASELTTLRATWLAGAAKPNNMESSVCKAHAGGAVREVTQGCVDLLGPMGISRDHLLEKWMRDCRITDIYEGTGEIQRLIIARGLLDYTRADLK